MNNRELSTRARKNKLREFVNQRIAIAKEKAKPEPLSHEKQLEADAKALAKAKAKALGFAAWEAKKLERKRLRSKHHVAPRA